MQGFAETGISPSGTGGNTRVRIQFYPLVPTLPRGVSLYSGPNVQSHYHYLIRKGFQE